MPPSSAQLILNQFIAFSLPQVTNTSTVVALPDYKAISPADDTKASDLYAKHYFALKNAGKTCSSFTVSRLTLGVQKAQLAYVLWVRANRPEVDPTDAKEFGDGSLQDFAGSLQLLIYKAANWIRRFAYERNRVDHWYDEQERREALELAEEMRSKGDKLINWLNNHEEKQTKARAETIRNSEAEWNKQEEALTVTDKQARMTCRENLDRGLNEAYKKIKNLRFFIRELEDSRGTEPLDQKSQDLIQKAKALLKLTQLELETPLWRNQGIQTLGPMGIIPVLDEATKKPVKFLTTNLKTIYSKPPKSNEELAAKRKNGVYTVSPEFCSAYPDSLKTDGKLVGALSPLFFITIKRTDDTFKLIRIPKDGMYFAWAYPIMTSTAEVANNFKDTKPTSKDLFLTLGGYVYFDKNLELIQANSISLSGSQLQFSSPIQLEKDILKVLDDQGRFAPITLEGLKDATHFAWILPGEFSDNSYRHPLPRLHPGAFAYKYPDSEKNNYFILAAVDTVTGKQKVETKANEDD